MLSYCHCKALQCFRLLGLFGVDGPPWFLSGFMGACFASTLVCLWHTLLLSRHVEIVA